MICFFIVFPPKTVSPHHTTKKGGQVFSCLPKKTVAVHQKTLCIKRRCASLLVCNPEYDFLCKNNVQTSSLNVQNSFSDVQNFLSDIQNFFSHIKNFFSNVRNSFSDVRNLFSHIQNFLSDVENIFSHVQNSFSHIQNVLSYVYTFCSSIVAQKRRASLILSALNSRNYAEISCLYSIIATSCPELKHCSARL